MPVPSKIQKLIEYFIHLPGIGPRQASRFAYALLDANETVANGLAQSLMDLKRTIVRCAVCGRAIEKTENHQHVCTICRNQSDFNSIVIVEKDQDLEAIERSGYSGSAYHLLGGLVLNGKKEGFVHERVKKLYERIKKSIEADSGRKKPIEVIIALSATPEGDGTALYLERVLELFIKQKALLFTRLGRGLSTGSELEYADPETIKFALKNRK